MIATRKQNLSPKSGHELVSVTLKVLIDLAKPAAGLTMRQTSSRSRQSGNYLSHFKGRGMEFDETRLYQAGDDIRAIDWRVTARTGKAHTKLFREERERPVFISIDHRPAMHFATRGVFKSVLAAKLAALLAWAAEAHGDRIGGQVFTHTSCHELKPKNGKQGVLKLFNALVKTPHRGNGEIFIEQALSRLAHHVRPGSMVYLISDFRGMNSQAEAHLAKLAQHCDVVLLFVYDSLESALPEKGCYRFTYDQRDITIDANDRLRLSTYQQNFIDRQQQLALTAKKMRAAFIPCNTSDDPVHILQASLNHR